MIQTRKYPARWRARLVGTALACSPHRSWPRLIRHRPRVRASPSRRYRLPFSSGGVRCWIPRSTASRFGSMDRIFTTRTVARSGPVWRLPRADHALDFSYEFQGQRFTPEQFLERTYTNALLILKDGRIVSEIYRNNTDESTRFMAFSMTKSITSILIGRALEEKRIASLDDAITKYLPELGGGGYNGGVTIRQVLQMRSGVDYEERYDFGNPAPPRGITSSRS